MSTTQSNIRLNWASFVRAGDLVFDVGANIGAKAEMFLQRGARVVCVEPQPACLKTLQKKFSRNPNVTIVPEGLSEAPGTLNLSICSSANTISTFQERWKTGRFSDYKWDKVIPVSMTTLDALIEKHGVPKYCKVDVEGFELSVLKGLSRIVPLISFEFAHEFLDDTRECLARLEKVGYTHFNFACREDPQLVAPDWLGVNGLLDAIAKIQDNRLWGDIYAYDGKAKPVHPPFLCGNKTLGILESAGIYQPSAPLRLHLGCGEQYLPGYVNVDYPAEIQRVTHIYADALANILELDFPDNSVDEIRLHHLFEHFDRATALAVLMRWHKWLKPGGLLRIETPDFIGSAKAVLLPRVFSWRSSWKVKMCMVRHLTGNQADSWGYHRDHWFPQRFKHTLAKLGFSDIKTKTRQQPDKPYLANVEVTAHKQPINDERQLEAADELLWESAGGEVERPMHEIWKRQLRTVAGSKQ
jgi:FkbM family methyltransferase